MADRCDDLAGRGALGDERRRARVLGTQQLLVAAVHGQDDQAPSRILISQLAAQVDSVAVREPHVDDDHVRRDVVDHRASFGDRPGLPDDREPVGPVEGVAQSFA